MTTDLIKDTSDFIVSVLPSKLGAINDAIVTRNILIIKNFPERGNHE